MIRPRLASYRSSPILDCCHHYWKWFVLIGSRQFACQYCFKRWQLVLDADGHSGEAHGTSWGWEEVE